MRRGRVELKRIDNKINRQVTFAKRRNGLLKKAYELSVLCEAKVALIIFSNRGKLYEFCSGSSRRGVTNDGKKKKERETILIRIKSPPNSRREKAPKDWRWKMQV
ncbi:hypothetical protein TIFTF001_043069 [Ficus carica]|uniref:MADS-box domain-containing protein n=1 Tax=Ficus carica TaxID=3494 RepID=A0AA87Z7B4_FICCA|nr:hypothetical protein TIFTF001_043069 [Ficus carica]